MELDQLTDEQIANFTSEQIEMLENDPGKLSEIMGAESTEKETAKEPEQEVQGAANGAGEDDEPVGVSTKNGKGIIPYEKHKELRVENSTLKQQLQEAQSKLDELQKAKDEAKTPKEEEKADDAIALHLDKVKEEMPDIHTAITAVHEDTRKQIKKAVEKNEEVLKKTQDQLSELMREREEAENARKQSILEQVAEAKDNNPDLSHWETNDPDAFEEAVRQDEIVRNSAKWANKPYAERFDEVVRRVRAIMPEASKPKKQPEPEAVKAEAKAKLEKAPVRKPTTLSDLPGGVNVASSETEELNNLEPLELARKLMTMPEHKARAMRSELD